MKQKICAIALILLFLLISLPVQAVQTMTITDLSSGSDRDVFIYSNNTLQGTYNLSSVIPIPTSDYQVVLRPQNSDFLSNPTDWLSNHAFPWVRTNATAILFIAIIVGIALSARRS